MSCSVSIWGCLGSGGLGEMIHPDEGDHAKTWTPTLGRGPRRYNKRLESKFWEHLEQESQKVRDWGHDFKTIEDLRAQYF